MLHGTKGQYYKKCVFFNWKKLLLTLNHNPVLLNYYAPDPIKLCREEINYMLEFTSRRSHWFDWLNFSIETNFTPKYSYRIASRTAYFNCSLLFPFCLSVSEPNKFKNHKFSRKKVQRLQESNPELVILQLTHLTPWPQQFFCTWDINSNTRCHS